jgi:hypothetical protein
MKLKNIQKQLMNTKNYLYTNIKAINDSKMFAGIVILLMNISSKFITLPIPKTVESYVKHSFSNYVLVFAICWMGTRDVFVAVTVMGVFAILMEFVFNENSMFCCLSEGFVSNQIQRLEEPDLTKEEIDNSIKVLEKSKQLLEKASTHVSVEKNANMNH